MKKKLPLWIMSIAASFILTTGLLAQDKTEVTVKIKKDGEVVSDTTYMFDDMDEARHALEIMDLLTGEELHKEDVHYNITTAHAGSGHSKAMVFISEDGETTEITEFSGDTNVWVSKEEGDGEHVKVMKYKIDEDGDSQGKKVIVMKSEDGSTFDILVDEEIEGDDVVKTKEIKVMVSGDEEGNWTVVEGDDEVKVKVMKVIEEEGDGENVKVIVIKSVDKDCDHDEDHDADCDHDEDVEVKVVKKKVKKEKE